MADYVIARPLPEKKGGGATDPNWFQTGTQAGLNDARAQMDRGEITPTQYYQFELNTLGVGGYKAKYPEVFGGAGIPPAYQWGSSIRALQAEVQGLQELRRQYTGVAGTYLRWMLDNTIRGLSRQLARWQGRTVPRAGGEPEPPMPNWMREYLDQSVPAVEPPVLDETRRRARGLFGREEQPPTTPMLRPLGAQAELTPAQMELMGGYLGWAKAGSPTKIPFTPTQGTNQYGVTHGYKPDESGFSAASDWQKHWDAYTRLSQSLFPAQTKLGKNWRTPTQR